VRGVGHGLRAAQIQALVVRGAFQVVYRSFCLKIPGQQARVWGEYLQMVVIISGI